MVWDFAESNVFSEAAGDYRTSVHNLCKALEQLPAKLFGFVGHVNAPKNSFPVRPATFSTDPPYYDNIGYADLSDFFYVWLKRSLGIIWSDLFRRLTTPKDEELVATPYRHGNKGKAEMFFMKGMSEALTAMRKAATDTEPLTIYYAFKQSEIDEEGIVSAGWAAFLQAVVDSGLAVDGTWPVRTERAARSISIGTNALASSIVLVCRKRSETAAIATRAEFIRALKREMPDAIEKIRKAGVGPVDMQQSVIGPGMGIFTRHAKILEDDDSPMGVKTALALINRVWGEIENELDGNFDAETQVALAWFADYGFEVKPSGALITISNAKNVPSGALFASGVFKDLHGKTCLMPRAELPKAWSPLTDKTLTIWECVQHTARTLGAEDGGAEAAARLVAGMGANADSARALAYRLYEIAAQKGWAAEALIYNQLAQDPAGGRRRATRWRRETRRARPGRIQLWSRLMSTEKETLRRVQDALFHLRKGLAPFVAATMQQHFGGQWLHYASRAAGGSPNAALDEYGLLKTMIDNWNEAFGEAFPKHEKHRVRGFVTTAFDARNSVSHAGAPIRDNEALRFLDAIHELLKAVKAPPGEIAPVAELYAAQGKSGFVTSAAARPAQTRLSLPVAEAETKAGLKPWIKVVNPNLDVLEGRFTDAEFAADLFAVDSGQATDEYGSAQSFFRITFLTEGLKRVLTSTLRRLSGKGGDPVIGLQTSFGGGKTHTMLAVYHLAQSATLDGLAGTEALTNDAGVTQWRKPRVAAFVGTSKGADVSLVLKDGPRVHTIWGYLAWRLAGETGLALMAEAEAARTNPGSELLVELFKLAGPSVILLDELVAYARQLSDERFEAFLSFIQSLTEAAKMVPGVLVIGSLPESDAEAGRDKGKTALLRLEKVFGRVQSPWLPASGDETYEIIRRRLFQELDGDVVRRERDATVKAFAEMYRSHAAEFPPAAKEARYAELLRLSYPIHPELFDRLSKDWASLEKFQRTRGVLRFMANVIYVLWKAQVSDPLIMPGRVPIANERVKAAILNPLEAGFGAVIDKEVDGDFSLPAQMETNPQRRITQMQAATRAARAVFLGSAPLAGQPNAGINGPALRLACAEPGDQLAIFGEAARELADQATYLHGRSGLYWFSTKPTLNRLAEERAKAFAGHEVDAAIRDVLVAEGNIKGSGFHRIFAAPDDPAAMDEVQSISLVILGPASPHSGKGTARSAATDAVTEALTRCRASQRRFRNTLIFVAADENKLGEARQWMRRSLAWDSICKDRALKGELKQSDQDDAAETAKTNRQRAVAMIRAAWTHGLYPFKTDATAAGSGFELEHLLVTPKEGVALPVAVYDKASVKGDAIIKETLGAQTLWKELKPLWGEDRPHLAVNEIAEWFASYVYLPKLRDRPVLEAAIREAVGKLDAEFGYAEQFDEAGGRYVGLVWEKLPPEFMSTSAVIVRADIAAAHQPPKQKTDNVELAESGGGPSNHDLAGRPVEPKAPPQPRRFYGSVEIDPARPVKSFDTIFNAVVMELQRSAGSKITLTLDIAAEAPEGFPEADIGVVRDNARQLKFKAESTGFD
jgi:hypothetical protein